MVDANKRSAAPDPVDAWSDPNSDGLWGQQDDAIVPLDAEQAARWRVRHRQISPVQVLQWQAVAAVAGTVLVWLVAQETVAIISWLYGFLAIWLPAALFARVVVRQPSLGMLVVCEMAKLLLSTVLIALAVVVLDTVAWPMLVGAIVLTVNMYWIAAIWLSRSRGVQND